MQEHTRRKARQYKISQDKTIQDNIKQYKTIQGKPITHNEMKETQGKTSQHIRA